MLHIWYDDDDDEENNWERNDASFLPNRAAKRLETALLILLIYLTKKCSFPLSTLYLPQGLYWLFKMYLTAGYFSTRLKI